MEKLYHGNTNQDKSDLAILILDRMDFQARSFARDKEGYFVRRKKSSAPGRYYNFKAKMDGT